MRTVLPFQSDPSFFGQAIVEVPVGSNTGLFTDVSLPSFNNLPLPPFLVFRVLGVRLHGSPYGGGILLMNARSYRPAPPPPPVFYLRELLDHLYI